VASAAGDNGVLSISHVGGIRVVVDRQVPLGTRQRCNRGRRSSSTAERDLQSDHWHYV